jgi:hypothetical protein
MYDRQTGSLWSHMTGEALEGSYKGQKLKMLAALPIVKWKVWRDVHPDTQVLTIRGREDQRRDNYWDYHSSSRTGLFPPEHQDKRLSRKDLVIGVGIGGHRKAYSTEEDLWKSKQRGNWKLIQDTIGETPVLVYHDPNNYTSAVYDRRIGEKTIQFKENTVGISAVDNSGQRWNMLTGTGPEDKSLRAIPHLNIYWFAWVDFYPTAELYQE